MRPAGFGPDDRRILLARISLDGLRLIRDEARGPQDQPEAIGVALAHKLKEQGAGEILEEIFATVRPEA